MKRLLRLVGAAAGVILAIAACSSGDGSSDSAAPSVATTTSATAPTIGAPAGGEGTSSDDNGSAAASGIITIQNFAFGAPLTVKPGATIKVTNMDRAAHDVASDDQDEFRTPLLNHAESATFTAPTEPGAYKFSCTVHAQMHEVGTLVVQD